MINQTPISAKIDTQLLRDLDAEVYVSARKRNSIINSAIRVYLDLLDANRRAAATQSSRPLIEIESIYFVELESEGVLGTAIIKGAAGK